MATVQVICICFFFLLACLFHRFQENTHTLTRAHIFTKKNKKKKTKKRTNTDELLYRENSTAFEFYGGAYSDQYYHFSQSSYGLHIQI